jgi:cytochrome P450/NADPH-cytochrome P450 reductase
VIVCASYNGAPPDNAAAFYAWLQNGMPANALAGVRYMVFGCGNRNWASTYQAVPRFIDERLAAFGAERVYARGEGDAQEDLDGQFRTWRLAVWNAVATGLGIAIDTRAENDRRPRYAVDVVAGPQANALAAMHGAGPMTVLANRELAQNDAARSTRHVELALPAGAAYGVGDHVGIVAENPAALVQRVLRRFEFAGDAYVRLTSASSRPPSLPVDTPIALARLLAHHVELQQPATRAQVATLAEHTRCPDAGPQLRALAEEDAYLRDVRAPRRSVLDLLERFPACELPFASFLDMLPIMTPRYYSVSSSPLADPARCSITVGVVREPAWSGAGTYEGVASTYVARHDAGTTVDAFVKESRSGFHLPGDPACPIVMIGPGTGVAPFRGFLHERAVLADRGAPLGPAMLFFGCRRPDEDYLYRDELEAFAARGFVELHVAFSRLDPARKTYVQHAIDAQADRVWALIEGGAVIYVCGDGSRMEPDVRAALIALHGAKTGAAPERSRAWLEALAAEQRYVLDVWASA